MKSISNDARGFVEGVISHLKQNEKGKEVSSKVESLLFKMTSSAKREHRARVESAVKLTSQEEQAIAKMLARLTGHEVSLTNIVEPSLIGGIRVTMGDWVVDSSLKNQLQEMARIVKAS